MKRKLCAACIRVRDNPIFWPTHLVHPEHGKLGVWSIYSEAVCRECKTTWRHRCDNTAEIVTR